VMGGGQPGAGQGKAYPYQGRLVAFARPSPCGQTVTWRKQPYSTSTYVDSFKLLFKKLAVAPFVQLPVLLTLKFSLEKGKKVFENFFRLYFSYCASSPLLHKLHEVQMLPCRASQ